MGDDGTLSWRELHAEAASRLDAVDARRIIEEVSGFEGAEWFTRVDEPVTVRALARFEHLVERRAAGEPLQYVLGHWAFRHLDLLVDRRVLIPRPETEQLVEVALGELRAVVGSDPARVADLGTGSGAIALSIATERPRTDVWATDRSPDAVAVARANLAGLGRAAAAVTLLEGSWFDALPVTLHGSFDLIVSNPPYIAEADALDAVVAEWEPAGALWAGPEGTEDLRLILEGARRWLTPAGVVAVECAPDQAAPLATWARGFYASTEVVADLSGRPRIVVARRGALRRE